MNLKTRLAELAGISKDPFTILKEMGGMGGAMCPKCNAHPCVCGESEEVSQDGASFDKPTGDDVTDLSSGDPSASLDDMSGEGDGEVGGVFPLSVVVMGDEGQKTDIKDFAALVDFVRNLPEDADLSQYSLEQGQPDEQGEDEIPSDVGDDMAADSASDMSTSGEGPGQSKEVDAMAGNPVKKFESVTESTTPKSSVKNKKPEIKTWDARPESGSGSKGKSSVHNKERTVDDGVASSIKSKEAAKPAANGGGLDSSSSGKSSVNNKKQPIKALGAKPVGGSGDVPKTTPKPSHKPKKVDFKGEIDVPAFQGKPEDTTAKSSLHMQQHPEVKGSVPSADKSHTPGYNPKNPSVGSFDTSPASGKQPAKVPTSSAKAPDVKVGDFTDGPDADPIDAVKSKIPAEIMSKLNTAIDNAKKSFDAAIGNATLDNTESIPGSGERDRFSSVLGTLNKVKELLSRKNEDGIKHASTFVTSLPNHIRKEIPVEVNLFIGKAIHPLSISDKFKEIKASRAKSKGM